MCEQGSIDINGQRFIIGNASTSVGHCDASRDTTTASIIQKWKSRDCFVRYVDGHKLRNIWYNVRVVSLKDAMVNIDTWTTNWQLGLDEAEQQLVQTAKWRKGLLF